MQLEPGLFLYQAFLPVSEQQALWERCRTLAEGPVPMYTPTVRGGRKMSVGMLCLGRHWNALAYDYEERRTDYDDQAVPPIPDEQTILPPPEVLVEYRDVRYPECTNARLDQGDTAPPPDARPDRRRIVL